MKKHWISLLTSPPVPSKAKRALQFLAAVLLAQAVLGCAHMAEPGAGSSACRGNQPAPSQPAPLQPAHAYLPALGPAPLRIQSTNAAPRTVVLPPLVMDDPPPAHAPALSSTNHPVVASKSVPPGVSAPSPLTAPPFLQPAVTLSPPVLGFEPAAPIVTPQMLVQFFKPVGSNNLGGVWSAPVFVPPSPPPAKSSTATYLSP